MQIRELDILWTLEQPPLDHVSKSKHLLNGLFCQKPYVQIMQMGYSIDKTDVSRTAYLLIYFVFPSRFMKSKIVTHEYGIHKKHPREHLTYE